MDLALIEGNMYSLLLLPCKRCRKCSAQLDDRIVVASHIKYNPGSETGIFKVGREIIGCIKEQKLSVIGWLYR